MQSAASDDGPDRVESLVAELRAIKHWDAGLWQKSDPTAHEMLAFITRRKRHFEIMSQLELHISPYHVHQQGWPWIVRKKANKTNKRRQKVVSRRQN